MIDYQLVHALFLQLQRNLVQYLNIAGFDNGIFINVTEHGNLFAHAVSNRCFRPYDQNVWLNPQTTQFANAVLSWFSLHFARGMQVWNQRSMNVEYVFGTGILFHFPNGFHEWL